MADVAKPAETAPVAEPVVEKKTEETPAVTAPAATEEAAPAPAVEADAAPVAAAETTEAPAATEEAAKEPEEAKPVEDGHLSHKPEGGSFPKNLIHSKKFFWFGSEPVDVKATPSFKADKVAEVAHHVTAWAAETGKGLLFFGEKDKSAPQGAIQLAEASEPQTDGTHKFHFVSKGHKHSFKAATTVERDAWVAQIKAKIAEAKELAATVTESETYKKTLESLKPVPAKKEEKPVEPAAEAAAEAPATEAAAAPAAEEAAPAAEAPKEEAKEEAKKEEEPKRRSASRKRASIFGTLLGKKEEKKVEAAPEAEAPVAETSAAAEAHAATEAPAATTETPAAEPAAEVKAEEKAEEKKEEPAVETPKPAKRASLFGALSFGKKKVTSPEPTPTTEEAPATTEAVAETAPVIPAVETTEPLSAEVSSPATVPTETTEAAPATNGETKKEVKSDKRKSSLPFVGGFLKSKAATSDDEAEKAKPTSPFSKLRATIKGKKSEKTEKAEEKTDDKAEEKTEETPAPAAAETSAAAEAEAPKPAEAEATAPEEPAKPVAATPVVTAAA